MACTVCPPAGTVVPVDLWIVEDDTGYVSGTTSYIGCTDTEVWGINNFAGVADSVALVFVDCPPGSVYVLGTFDGSHGIIGWWSRGGSPTCGGIAANPACTISLSRTSTDPRPVR